MVIQIASIHDKVTGFNKGQTDLAKMG